MAENEISPELRTKLESVTAKRPKTVIDHILKYGYITNHDLNQIYGYEHAPRAIRDVRELGIPLETFKVSDPGNKKITAYRFATGVAFQQGKQGRRAFPKKLKQELLQRDGERCNICKRAFPASILQIDHKVPYEVAGDKAGDFQPEEFMLVCGSCNRAKSWECEHCDNWRNTKLVAICNSCLFGSPEDYEHIAMEQKRSLTLDWEGEEVQDYDLLKQQANEASQDIQVYVKSILKNMPQSEE